MAPPNHAAVAEMVAFAADLLEELESYTATSTTGLVDTVTALRNDLEGDFAQDTRTALQSVTDAVASVLSKESARQILNPLLRQWAVAINYANPNGSISELWEALYDHFHANSETLNDPEDTFDTSWTAGGSNVGNGEVLRLTVDENGYVLAGFDPDSFTLTCTRDARNRGTKHEELFDLEGTDPHPNNLKSTGSGLVVKNIQTFSARASKPYVKNPSFNSYTLDGSSNLTALPGWTANSGTLSTNLSINTTYTHRTTPGESGNASLQFTGDEIVYQDLVATGGASVDPNDPFLIDFGVAKVGSPTGTFTLRLSGSVGSGGITATLAHGAMTGSGTFDRLRIAVGANCWAANWNANDVSIQIGLGSSGSIDASNYFLVDDLVFAPWKRIGRRGDPRKGRGSMGQYLAIVGGSTPFVKGDTFTATDSAGTRATNHWALSRIARYGYLPVTTGGTESVSDK